MEQFEDRTYTREEMYAAYDKGQVVGLHRCGHARKYMMDKLGFPRDQILMAITEYDARARRPNIHQGGLAGHREGSAGFDEGGGDDAYDEFGGARNEGAGMGRRASMSPAFDNEPYANQWASEPFQMKPWGIANLKQHHEEVRAVTPMARAATQGIEQGANATKSQQENDDDNEDGEVEFLFAHKLNPSQAMRSIKPDVEFISANKVPATLPAQSQNYIPWGLKRAAQESVNREYAKRVQNRELEGRERNAKRRRQGGV
jgi:hypothetical protein